ncbi:HNH endonuclease [Kocuria tytonicola]|nr:HNH endonuclease [Kocuria tytonicola]
MPHAAPTRCTARGCSAFATRKGRCDEHQSSGWTERRRPQDDRTSRDRIGISEAAWQRLRKSVLVEHEGICYVCGKPGANEVDHKQAVALGGARTDRANLAPIHADPCHAEKTQRELALLRRRADRARRSPA